MKTLVRFILALGLSLAFALPAPAIIKQVTNVGAAASTILTPGKAVKTIIIQNNGSGDVRISIDGGTTNGLTDPTSSTGYLLKAGTQIALTFVGGYQVPRIRAILVTGTTTTLDLVTDDAASI